MKLLDKKFILKNNTLFLDDVKFKKSTKSEFIAPKSEFIAPKSEYIGSGPQNIYLLLKDEKFKYNLNNMLSELYEYPTLIMRDIYKYINFYHNGTFEDEPLKNKIKTYKMLDGVNFNEIKNKYGYLANLLHV